MADFVNGPAEFDRVMTEIREQASIDPAVAREIGQRFLSVTRSTSCPVCLEEVGVYPEHDEADGELPARAAVLEHLRTCSRRTPPDVVRVPGRTHATIRCLRDVDGLLVDVPTITCRRSEVLGHRAAAEAASGTIIEWRVWEHGHPVLVRGLDPE